MSGCTLCPRECGADRSLALGLCGCNDEIYIARIMLHMWEEPSVSGERGSGAVFFCGCPLGCAFCQNREISRTAGDGRFISAARRFTPDELVREFLSLERQGAHNINLVSPTQHTEALIYAVREAKLQGLRIPVVWNTGGYEKADTIRMLKDTADIFLTDIKFYSHDISSSLSEAGDYFEYAFGCLKEMINITGDIKFGEDGMLRRGTVVRHLVLPGCRHDSVSILEKLAQAGMEKHVLLSLMSQYTPDTFGGCSDSRLDKFMRRRVTDFEYSYVCDTALKFGFDGYMQDRTSSVCDYIPHWGFGK